MEHGEVSGAPAAAGRRPGLVTALRWSGALVVLALLAAGLLSLPFQLYAVRTGSMQPAFAPRAVVVVHEGVYRQGQPISFTHRGEVVTHRFVSLNPDGTIVTQGDANETIDPWIVRPSEVLGGVVASVPGVGYWLVYLRSPAGASSFVLAAVALCVIWPLGRELDRPAGALVG